MSQPVFDHDDTKLLFEALFDMRALLADIVEALKGGEDDGEEEEEDAPGS